MNTVTREIKHTKEVVFGKHCKQVVFGLSYTNHAYFSVTGQIGTKTTRQYDFFRDADGNKYRYETCGCIHDDILKTWPDMADIIALHLSDENGVPMHAVENGYYWLQQAHRENLKNHLRVNDDELQNIINTVKTKNDFIKIVADLMPRWKAEADAVLTKYNLH